MPNALEVEKAFETLKRRLQAAPSIRGRFVLVGEFLARLEPSFENWGTYLLELTDWLPAFGDPLTFTGIDPSDFEPIFQRLIDAGKDYPELKEISNYRDSVASLRYMLAFQYAVAGKPFETLRILGYTVDSSLKQWEQEQPDFLPFNRTPFDFFESFLTRRRESTGELGPTLKKIYREWSENRWMEGHSGLIPVVEVNDDSSESPENKSVGRLRRLQVSILSTKNSSDEELYFQFQDKMAAERIEDLSAVILSSVRQLVEENRQNIDTGRYLGHFRFDHYHYDHTGTSLGLAAAALYYQAILDSGEFRERFRVNPATAITGQLDVTGRVRPVKEEAIEQKVKAAFFSWAETLVVPASQRDKAYRICQRLNKKYPRRSLFIFGARRLADLFSDRRITSHKQYNLLQHYGSKLWKRKFSTLGILVILILGFITVKGAYGPLEKNPTQARFDGSYLFVENKYGQVLDRIEVGDKMVQNMKENKIKPSEAVAFTDASGDDDNEVIWVGTEGDENSLASVYCRSISGDSLLWKNDLTFELDFPEKPSIVKTAYIFRQLHVLDTPKGERLVVNLRHPTFFPAVIQSMNISDGKVIDRYVHPGFLYDMLAVDLDKDGYGELVAGGINNAYKQAIISVLEPLELSGHAPLTSEYRLKNIPKAKEKTYLRIPRTKISLLFKDRVHHNNIKKIRKVQNREELVVTVRDLAFNQEEIFNMKAAHLMIYFNYQLVPLRIGTDSHFDYLVDNLVRSGDLAEEPDAEYFEAYKDSLLYWNGEGWQTDNFEF